MLRGSVRRRSDGLLRIVGDRIQSVGLMDADYNIYDGAHIEHNCTDINKVQFSYNMGVWLLGAANMYNFVSPPIFSPDLY